MRFTFFIFALVFSFQSRAEIDFATPSVIEENIQKDIVNEIISGRKKSSLKLESVTDDSRCSVVRCMNEIENFAAAAAIILDKGTPLHARKLAARILKMLEEANLVTADEIQLYTLWRSATLKGAKRIPTRIHDEWATSLSARIEDELQRGLLAKKTKFILESNSVPNIKIWANLKRTVTEDAKTFSVMATPKDLVYGANNIAKYDGGKFANKPALFMFCRENRIYPCLLVMKNSKGELHTRENGTIWYQPSLGLSSRRLDYNQTNGQTPQGVFRIDGVMPDADRQMDFGKNRRLILNFVADSNNEIEMKKLLPASHHSSAWWLENTVARDIGRGSFRVHGSGYRSKPGTPYYTFIATAGCVAQRENTYDGVTYNDQRLLLNELMKVQGLPVKEANETAIKALLYVYELDNKAAAVTIADIARAGLIK